jgi:hypothetical protein
MHGAAEASASCCQDRGEAAGSDNHNGEFGGAPTRIPSRSLRQLQRWKASGDVRFSQSQRLPTTTDYHFFREGIMPTWEDHNNAKGGGSGSFDAGLASRYWEEIILALIGLSSLGFRMERFVERSFPLGELEFVQVLEFISDRYITWVLDRAW